MFLAKSDGNVILSVLAKDLLILGCARDPSRVRSGWPSQ